MRTYGVLKFHESNWHVKCEPHVAIKLRRVFAQIGQWQQGFFKLSDSLDCARDLQWFMERYPLEMDDATRSNLESRCKRHVEQTALVDALLAGTIAPTHVELARAQRPYQGIASELAYVKRRLLLADDVGLGKTTSAIGLLARQECRPAVVVTLTHLPRQWEAELNTVAPGLRVHIINKTQIYDITAGRKKKSQPGIFGIPDVILISYSKLMFWAETLAPLVRTAIFDEVQELRHRGTKKYAAGRHLAGATEWCMGLSATPFYNYGGEMWAVTDCISPGALGTWDEFANEWCVAGDDDKPSIKDPKAFGAYMREEGLMLRRTRKDVDRELPPVSKIPQLVDSDKMRLAELSASCMELASAILRSTEAFRGEKMHASEQFSMVLRQATGIAKAPYVAEFVRLLVESGEKVVLYGWHREVYSIWLNKLDDLKPSLYTGTESVTQKDEAKRRFVQGETNVMVISLRSGAGLDGLQHRSRTVVIGELDWSPGVLEQCIGRVARDGQTEPVAVYYMLSNDGADPYMSEVLGIKRQQIEGMRNGEESLIEDLQTDGGNNIRRMAEAYMEKHRMSKSFLEGAEEPMEVMA